MSMLVSHWCITNACTSEEQRTGKMSLLALGRVGSQTVLLAMEPFAHVCPTAEPVNKSWQRSTNTYSEGQMVNEDASVLHWKKRWISLLRNQLPDIAWQVSTELGTTGLDSKSTGISQQLALKWGFVSGSPRTVALQRPPCSFLWTLLTPLLCGFGFYLMFYSI
jgi:hypothetical protein